MIVTNKKKTILKIDDIINTIMTREKKTIQVYLETWEELTVKKSQTGSSHADIVEELQKMINGGDCTAKKILNNKK